MSNLFLASQIQDVTAEKFVKLLGKSPQDSSLCFIATAGNLQGKKPEERGSWQALIKFGFKPKILDVAGKSHKEVASALQDTDIVLINGGNTFYLLDHVRKSGTDVEIKKLLERGGWYLGSSAGSVLATPDIDYVAPMDDPQLAPDLKDYSGLNLVDVSIVPHVGNPDYPDYKKVIAEYSGTSELIELSDEQVLLVKNGEKKVI